MYKLIGYMDIYECPYKYEYLNAILQLVEQINQSFEKNEFTLSVFVDLSKALSTTDQQILLKN